MAKAKKKENLTSEERLRAALVPNWEQPYKVPENWCWVKFGYLATDIADGPFGSNLKSEHYTQEKEVRIIQLSNIGENGWREENTKYTTFLHAESISRSIVQPGDLVIAKMMPAGRAIICPNNEAKYVLSSDAVKFVPYRQISTKFLLYSINSNYFQCQVQGNTQGITRARTSIKKLKCYAFALPPLPEQQRIVDRIESLFAKLDEAKQKAQNALDSFETRKAAILHKAFTGELTAQWRKEHGVGMESWKNRTLSQLAKQIKAGGDKPDDFTETADKIRNIPVVANGITNEGIVGYTSTVRFSGETITVAGRGTIGFSIYRTYPFFPIVRLIVIEPKDIVKAPYIKYAFDAFPENGTGSSIPQLTVPMVKEKIIPLPKLNEQTEIVRILDDLLAKEQQAKETAEAVLEQVDLIKKSILARAFRGELGTNDPAEESAVELVRNMI